MYFTERQRRAFSEVSTKEMVGEPISSDSESYFRMLHSELARRADQESLPLVTIEQCNSKSVSRLRDPRFVVPTLQYQVDYAKHCKNRRLLSELIARLKESDYFAEDALADSRGVSAAIVFAKQGSLHLTSEVEFIWREKLVRLEFSRPDDIMRVKSLVSGSFYEHYMLEDCVRNYQDGWIIDVGANVGNHTVAFGRILSPSSRLIAIEPGDRAFSILRRNVESNGLTSLVQLFNVAVGQADGFVALRQGSATNLGAMRVERSAENAGQTVPLRRLDDICPSDVTVDILKIDVEGFEPDVLKGAGRLLESQVRSIYIEAGTEDQYQVIEAALDEFGFSRVSRFNDTPTYLFQKSGKRAVRQGAQKMTNEVLIGSIRDTLKSADVPAQSYSDALERVRNRLALGEKRRYFVQKLQKISAQQGKALRQRPSESDFECSLCGYWGPFKPFGYKSRPNALCPACGSFERTRLMILYLHERNLLRKGISVLELAPTKSMSDYIQYEIGGHFTGVDIDPDPISERGIKVTYCDLCSDEWPELGSFDVIINSHVMEHVRCDHRAVIERVTTLLRPGGVHLIAVPFGGDHTREDLDPGLSADERLRRFGHPDHVRFFGHLDFPDYLRGRYGERFSEVGPSSFSDVEIYKYSLGTFGTDKSWNRLFAISSEK